MTNELFQFMVSKNIKSFAMLDKNKGNVVKITYSKMVPNQPPMQIDAVGPLENVSDFVSVQIGGKAYPFANKDGIIVEIANTKTGQILYDATLVVNKTTQFNEKTRMALGLPNPDSKYAYTAKKQFIESMNK